MLASGKIQSQVSQLNAEPKDESQFEVSESKVARLIGQSGFEMHSGER